MNNRYLSVLQQGIMGSRHRRCSLPSYNFLTISHVPNNTVQATYGDQKCQITLIMRDVGKLEADGALTTWAPDRAHISERALWENRKGYAGVLGVPAAGRCVELSGCVSLSMASPKIRLFRPLRHQIPSWHYYLHRDLTQRDNVLCILGYLITLQHKSINVRGANIKTRLSVPVEYHFAGLNLTDQGMQIIIKSQDQCERPWNKT